MTSDRCYAFLRHPRRRQISIVITYAILFDVRLMTRTNRGVRRRKITRRRRTCAGERRSAVRRTVRRNRRSVDRWKVRNAKLFGCNESHTTAQSIAVFSSLTVGLDAVKRNTNNKQVIVR